MRVMDLIAASCDVVSGLSLQFNANKLRSDLYAVLFLSSQQSILCE